MVVKRKLTFARMKRYKRVPLSQDTATDLLRRKMHFYDRKAKEITNWCLAIVFAGDKSQAEKVISLRRDFKAYDDIVIDCAHKLAPYESPKLESVELKQSVVHRMVIRTPALFKTTQEWMAATGAESLTEDQVKKSQLTQQKSTTPVPSIHDFDNSDERLRFSADRVILDDDDDEPYKEPGMLN